MHTIHGVCICRIRHGYVVRASVLRPSEVIARRAEGGHVGLCCPPVHCQWRYHTVIACCSGHICRFIMALHAPVRHQHLRCRAASFDVGGCFECSSVRVECQPFICIIKNPLYMNSIVRTSKRDRSIRIACIFSFFQIQAIGECLVPCYRLCSVRGYEVRRLAGNVAPSQV